jgi:hypothetical protein
MIANSPLQINGNGKAPMCNAFAERFVREARPTLNQIIPLCRRPFFAIQCAYTLRPTGRQDLN